MPLSTATQYLQPKMSDFQPAQHAAAPAPSTDVPAALPLESGHSQTAPEFSFDDEPLFGMDGPAAAALPDDFFSSPEWTDPSPALTTSMSFNLDSCDPSPLLTDNYEAPADFSGMPLFGDYNNHSLYATDHSSSSPKRSPQNAFSRVKDVNEESALLLLRAFNSHRSVNVEAEDKVAPSVTALSASPSAISSPLPSANALRPLLSSSSSSSLPVQDNRTHRTHSSVRGTKRRIETSDLLPIDAPVQPRTYRTPSATSRKESSSDATFAAEEAAIAAEKDPLVAKRLSNTLAARRSRHRKAEELRALNDTIEDLESEVEMWKRRCIRAEQELDETRSRGPA